MSNEPDPSPTREGLTIPEPGTEVNLRFILWEMDLSSVREGVKQEYGLGAEDLSDGERDYRMFLCLKCAYPDEIIVPTALMDMYWHQHIVRTEKYAADCRRMRPYRDAERTLLHHDPSSIRPGMEAHAKGVRMRNALLAKLFLCSATPYEGKRGGPESVGSEGENCA